MRCLGLRSDGRVVVEHASACVLVAQAVPHDPKP